MFFPTRSKSLIIFHHYEFRLTENNTPLQNKMQNKYRSEKIWKELCIKYKTSKGGCKNNSACFERQ